METKNIYKIPFLAFLVSLIAVPVRVYQYLNIINPEQGFYDKIDFSVYLLYGLLIVAGFTAILIPLIFRKKIQTVSACKNSTGFLVASLVFAVTIIVDCAITLIDYINLFSASIGTATSINEYVKAQGGSIMLMQVIFGGLSAVFFFVLGLSVGVGKSDGSKFKLLALSPVIWTIFKLLYRFKRTISFVNVSDLMFELFMIVFMMLYFLSFAQVISKVESSSVFFKTISYGVPAMMLACVCFIPRFVLTVIGKSDLLCSYYQVNYSDFGFVVFAAYNIISRIKTKPKIEE